MVFCYGSPSELIQGQIMKTNDLQKYLQNQWIHTTITNSIFDISVGQKWLNFGYYVWFDLIGKIIFPLLTSMLFLQKVCSQNRITNFKDFIAVLG